MKNKSVRRVISKIFLDRLYERCLLKGIDIDELAEMFSGKYGKGWLEKYFVQRDIPPVEIMLELSNFFGVSIDCFVEDYERVTDKSKVAKVLKERRIKHMEEALGRKIEWNNRNFKRVLADAAREALDKELMSISKAAAILEISVYDVYTKL